jgi:hypothetical protein
MVTSPGAGDGKTTVTMGVARALARLGHRVVIIQGGPGEENRALRGAAAAESGSDPLISVLSPDGQETADGDRGARSDLGALVESGRDRGDFVLIDGPSIHRLHGAPELTNVVDGVLLVARLRWTAKDSLRNTLDVLDAFAVRLLGLVLTDSVGLSTVTINARGAVIPLEIPVNGGDRYGASARRPRRAPTEVQTLTAGHVRASYDDGRAG